jgi:3-oxoacyl-[acyl-carrier protein] reductase
MAKRLAGKVAVVTGASKGIGAAIAKHLAAEGASVVVNYLNSKAGADRVVADIARNGGKAVAMRADVSNRTEIECLFAETKKVFGRLDILINNAGVYEFSPIAGVTEEHYYKQFDLNVLGLILTSQEAAKHFGSDGGSIVNISSVVSSLTPPNSSVYTGTKGTVDAATKSLAKELGPRKIRVNAINPGMVITEGVQAGGFAEGEFRKQLEAQTPLGRIGQPKDIAPAAVFLASQDASWITGETLLIAGGLRYRRDRPSRVRKVNRARLDFLSMRRIRHRDCADRRRVATWCRTSDYSRAPAAGRGLAERPLR